MRNKQKILWELYNENYEKAWRFARSIVRDPDLAQDVVQEAFINVYKNLHQLRDESKVVPWLMAIVRNCALAHLNRRSLDADMGIDSNFEPVAPKGDALQQLEEKEMKQMIIKAINSLHPSFQQVIILRFYYDFTYDEISQALNIEIGTVKSRIHRGKQYIAQILEKASSG